MDNLRRKAFYEGSQLEIRDENIIILLVWESKEKLYVSFSLNYYKSCEQIKFYNQILNYYLA